MNKLNKFIENLLHWMYKGKKMKIVIYRLPIVISVILLLTTLTYYQNGEYYSIYVTLTHHLGVSTGLVLVYGFFLYKHKFCLDSRIGWLNITFYNVINSINSYYPILGEGQIGRYVEVTGMIIFTTLGILALLKRSF